MLCCIFPSICHLSLFPALCVDDDIFLLFQMVLKHTFFNSLLKEKRGHQSPNAIKITKGLMYLILTALLSMSMIIMTGCMCQVHSACAWIIDPYIIYITVWDIMTKYLFPFLIWWQIFPGLILSDIKPAKKMKFKTVCYLLVQLMHCRKMFKAEIPFSNVMNCEDGDKV